MSGPHPIDERPGGQEIVQLPPVEKWKILVIGDVVKIVDPPIALPWSAAGMPDFAF